MLLGLSAAGSWVSPNRGYRQRHVIHESRGAPTATGPRNAAWRRRAARGYFADILPRLSDGTMTKAEAARGVGEGSGEVSGSLEYISQYRGFLWRVHMFS